MQEDYLKKKLDKFVLLLLKLTGLVKDGATEKAEELIRQYYNEPFILDFLKNTDDRMDTDKLFKEELQFQAELLRHQLIISQQKNTFSNNMQSLYIRFLQKLLHSSSTYDFTLVQKINNAINGQFD